MAPCSFIIHLERATQRQEQARKLLTSLPAPAELFAAVDGKALARDEKQSVCRRHLHDPRYPYRLSDGEIACFLSHRAVWQAILDRNLDHGLIVEDDVSLDEGFAEAFEGVPSVAGPNDYIRFPRWERGETGDIVYRTAGASIIEPFLPMLGTQMQLVGREAARRLLAATETFDRPIDSFIQMQWLHGARVLSARPIVISEIDAELGGTVLQRKKMPLAEKLVHEVRRPFFRHAIRRCNRQWRKGRIAATAIVGTST